MPDALRMTRTAQNLIVVDCLLILRADLVDVIGTAWWAISFQLLLKTAACSFALERCTNSKDN
eukprot:3733130-Rhodomonas_salina.4